MQNTAHRENLCAVFCRYRLYRIGPCDVNHPQSLCGSAHTHTLTGTGLAWRLCILRAVEQLCKPLEQSHSQRGEQREVNCTSDVDQGAHRCHSWLGTRESSFCACVYSHWHYYIHSLEVHDVHLVTSQTDWQAERTDSSIQAHTLSVPHTGGFCQGLRSEPGIQLPQRVKQEKLLFFQYFLRIWSTTRL